MASVLTFLMMFAVIYLAIKLIHRIVHWTIRGITAEVLRSAPSGNVDKEVRLENPDYQGLTHA